MTPWLIIGIGNPLREDDGIGWAVADGLAGVTVPGVALRVETAHQLLPEMAAWLAEVDGAIVVDAAVAGVPGAVAAVSIRPHPVETLPTLRHTHHLTPQALCDQTVVLFGRCPPLTLITVTAQQLGFGTTLSPPVAAAVPVVLNHITALLT